jgi:hypothetical protein
MAGILIDADTAVIAFLPELSIGFGKARRSDPVLASSNEDLHGLHAYGEQAWRRRVRVDISMPLNRRPDKPIDRIDTTSLRRFGFSLLQIGKPT